MKKLLILTQLIVCTMFYSSVTYADRDDWGDWDDRGYYSRPQINNYYMPPPQVYNYYPQPQVNYYPPPPPPQYYGYGWSSQAGMVGGAIGSMFGYQFSGGDPLATGIGAAAGAFMGNGYGMRR